jgi:hypothetical protein
MTRPALARLYRLWSDRGPCGACNFPQARHREWDSLDCDLRRRRTALALAREYGWTVAQIRAVAPAYAEARRLHRPLPGREARP